MSLVLERFVLRCLSFYTLSNQFAFQVFVEFNSHLEAQQAQTNLAGRKFANRVVVTSFIDPDKYRARDF